jgi:hypothetical protein
MQLCMRRRRSALESRNQRKSSESRSSMEVLAGSACNLRRIEICTAVDCTLSKASPINGERERMVRQRRCGSCATWAPPASAGAGRTRWPNGSQEGRPRDPVGSKQLGVGRQSFTRCGLRSERPRGPNQPNPVVKAWSAFRRSPCGVRAGIDGLVPSLHGVANTVVGLPRPLALGDRTVGRNA